MSRALERKKTLVAFCVLFLLMAILGICFVWTPSVYEYHLTLCERFVDQVCYSRQSVLLIFLERFAGNLLFLLPVIIGGIHPLALVLPPVLLSFRAYVFGGSLAVLLSVYQLSGVFIVLALYLPVHLLVDAVLLFATSVSFGRAGHFRFCKDDFTTLALDFSVFAVALAAICLLEMLLLLVLFHPLGNLI